MTKFEMKNCNMKLREMQQKYQHYHHVRVKVNKGNWRS